MVSLGWSTRKGSLERTVISECEQCGSEVRTPRSHYLRGNGRYCSIECRSTSGAYISKMSQAVSSAAVAKGKWKGTNNPNWRGGVAKERSRAMASRRYKEWRKAVYDRDGYVCVQCGVSGDGRNLNADHIKPWSLYPAHRYELDNGRTLCRDCHKKTDTYGWAFYNREFKWKQN